MERIRDKDHTERYDSLIATLSAEQAILKQELAGIKTGDVKLLREVQTLDKRAEEMTIVLENTIIRESVMRRLIEYIQIMQKKKKVKVFIKWQEHG